MKILFYRYGSICEPDIIDGFCELGNEVVTITEEIYNKKLLPSEGVALLNEALQKASYDFVFSINFYPFISEVCNIFQIRYLCWTVDSPVMELYSDSIRNPWNRIFLFDRAQYNEFSRYNPSCIFHLPLASNPTRWKKVISSATDDDISRFSGDKVSEDNEIPVSAILLPDFSRMTANDSLNAPAIRISETDIDLSVPLIKKKKASHDILIANAGKTPLVISKLQVFNSSVGVSLKKTVLPPDGMTKLKVTIRKRDVGNKKHHLRILMITNDPLRPKVEINIKR